jgi:hypothetical protein
MGNSQVILIDGATLTLARAEAILRGAKVVLANNIQKKIEASHTFMKQQPTVLNQKMSKSQIKKPPAESPEKSSGRLWCSPSPAGDTTSPLPKAQHPGQRVLRCQLPSLQRTLRADQRRDHPSDPRADQLLRPPSPGTSGRGQCPLPRKDDAGRRSAQEGQVRAD